MDGLTVRTLAYHLDRTLEMHDVEPPSWLSQAIDAVYASGETMLSHDQKMIFLQTAKDVLYYPDDYDTDVRQTFEERIKPGDCVVDVGASLGYYTLRAADLVGKEGHVYSFEPEQSRYDALEETVKINNLDGRVMTSDKPLADTTGEISIRERTSQEEWVSRTTDATTLNEAVDTVPNVIKIDCEGLEYHVLNGADHWLSEAKPDIFCEIHPTLIDANGYDVTDIENLMNEYGYQMYCVDARSPVKIETIPDQITHSLASATVLFEHKNSE